MAFMRNNNNNNNNRFGIYGSNNISNNTNTNNAIIVVPTTVVSSSSIANYLNITPKIPEAFEAFLMVDTDRSGEIDWKELQSTLQKSFGTPGRPFPGKYYIHLY